MHAATRDRLRALNRRFYRQHAAAFDATRAHPWPGWARIPLPGRGGPGSPPPRPLRVLDVGCGNGRYAEALLARLRAEEAARPARPATGAAPPGEAPLLLDYTGIDENATLLARARARLATISSVEGQLVESDVLSADPARMLPGGAFHLVSAFGLLHHVPGRALREALLGALAARVEPGGLLVFTAWQFADRPRFAGRTVPWSAWPAQALGPIEQTDLEPAGGAGPGAPEPTRPAPDAGTDETALRYCHHCSEAELDALVTALIAADPALEPLPRYSADGRSDDLNRYVLLRRPGAPAVHAERDG